MPRLPFFVLFLGICLLPATAQNQADAQRIEQCRQAVLACQLGDGAIVAVAYRELGRPALVEPYFAHLACGGILAAEQMKPNAQNRAFIANWLKWYALRQKEDKGLFVLDGTRGPNGLVVNSKKAPDSYDSYAALYLYVAGRYAKVAKARLAPEVVAACLRMLEVLESCRSPNDLFWNFPAPVTPQGNPRTEYLLDNIEVYQGLIEIVAPLAAVGRVKESKRAEELAAKLAKKLADFWSPNHAYYVCMYGDKAAGVPFGQQPLYAEGVATASALSLLDNAPQDRQEKLWKKFQDKHGAKLAIGYATPKYSLEDPTIERVHLAALRSAPMPERSSQLTQLKKRTDELLARNNRLGDPIALADGNPFPYCHRFGIMLLALTSPEAKATPYLPSVPLPAMEK